MRTVTFQSVYDGVLLRHNLDPLGDTISQDAARAVAAKIQKRMRRALRTWEFLEWSRTEERAFRTIWNDSRQFYHDNPATGQPDELFYIPTKSYYVVKGSTIIDPPIGTLPTDTTYFAPLTPVDTYLELDQACQPAMGRVLGVYPANPRLNGCGLSGLKFRPSEKGIDVCSPAGPTVFLSYMLPEPTYTKVPFIPGKTYLPGKLVFQPADGEVYRCLAQTSQSPPAGTDWAIVPVLESLANYAEAGAYADTLRDTFKEGDGQIRLANAQLASAEADTELEQEIDTLVAQGQKNYYLKRSGNYYGWCASQPWPGGAVTTLSDVCRQDWVFTPPAPSSALLKYVPSILSISGPDNPKLETYATASLSVSTMIIIRTGEKAVLETGPKDTGDPAQIAPLDYDVAINDKHWRQVS